MYPYSPHPELLSYISCQVKWLVAVPSIIAGLTLALLPEQRWGHGGRAGVRAMLGRALGSLLAATGVAAALWLSSTCGRPFFIF